MDRMLGGMILFMVVIGVKFFLSMIMGKVSKRRSRGYLIVIV